MKYRGKKQRGKRSHDAAKAAETHLIYGIAPVLEALQGSPKRVRKILVSSGRTDERIEALTEQAGRVGVPVNRTDRQEIDNLVPKGARHQGVTAYVANVRYSSADDLIRSIATPGAGPGLILDGVEDPRNLGAILRTAECSGVAGVFMPERRSAGITAAAVKTAAGAVDHLPIARIKNINRTIEALKSENVWVVGASGDGDMRYHDWDFSNPTVVVLGSEGKGIRRRTAELCDVLVSIPMYGNIESLNVSVAAGVLLFEAARQRAE